MPQRRLHLTLGEEAPLAPPGWTLTPTEREILESALDALLPPDGSFPAPSHTGIIDDFILLHIQAAGADRVPYPALDADGLRAIMLRLSESMGDMTTALANLELESPSDFLALWRIAVYGYYSRPETIAAIQRDLGVAYHGAPLPLGYPDVLSRFDSADALQFPAIPVGSYIPTEAVTRLDAAALTEELEAK